MGNHDAAVAGGEEYGWDAWERGCGITLSDYYDYCEEFLDRLSDQTEELVRLLAPACEDLERLKALVLAYVYSVCTGLECSDGHRECILGPLPFEEVVDTAQELLWMSQSEYWCEGPVFKLAKRAG